MIFSNRGLGRATAAPVRMICGVDGLLGQEGAGTAKQRENRRRRMRCALDVIASGGGPWPIARTRLQIAHVRFS